MDACPQVKKQMFIMPALLKRKNMPLKSTKLLFLFSKTEKNMLQESSDLEKDIARVIQEN